MNGWLATAELTLYKNRKSQLCVDSSLGSFFTLQQPLFSMSTSAKQFKALGDDVWKNKVEKIASIKKQYLSTNKSNIGRVECRALYVDLWIPGGATCQRL